MLKNPPANAGIQFSLSVVSDFLSPHGLQHARLLCPSPTPGAQTHVHQVGNVIQPSCSLSSPLRPAFNLSQQSGSFPMSQFFLSGGQSIGASALVFPVNTQDLFPLGLTGLISLQSKGLPRVFSNKCKGHGFNSCAMEFSRQEYWRG